MKIAHITAGAAGMYCGSCMNANTMAAALIGLGHEVALVPTYTPVRSDERVVTTDRVFYGALNVFLQEKVALFRHTPWLLDRLLDRPALLRWVSRFSGSTEMKELGGLTLSVLEGEHGHQSKELEKLVEWLAKDFPPDIVNLSFAFFLGFARRLKETLGVPVVCTLQGEDIVLDEMPEPYRTRILEVMRERAADVDAFVAPCQDYAERMGAELHLPPEKVHVTPLGIRVDDFGDASAVPRQGPPTLGYLARICPEKGLHLLVDAFLDLARRPGFETLRLRIAGYLGARDEAYFATQQRRIQRAGLAERVEHVGEVDREGKRAFLESLDVFSVPTVYREPKGLFLLEALASGVAAVQPRHGAFPEVLAETGGGMLVEPHDSEALAAGIAMLLEDAPRRQDMARRGRAAVHRDRTDMAAAERILAVYRHTRGEAVSQPMTTAETIAAEA